MPNYQKHIVYLSDEQRQELFTNGSITVNGQTVTYSDNDMYVTPQEAPVTDVQVNGTSVTANGVANVPRATNNTLGVISAQSANGVAVASSGALYVSSASAENIKAGTDDRKPITSSNQDASAFYGLAKAAGADMASSSNTVGTYTDEAKTAIKSMLGVTDPTVSDVQVAGTSVVQNGTANVPIANVNTFGVVRIASGLYNSNGAIGVNDSSEANIKAGNTGTYTNVSRQHVAAFYGLAKAAGANENNSTLPVGQYTETAKTAIRTMLGATSSDVVAIQDEQPTNADTKVWLPESQATGVEVPTMADLDNYVQKTDLATTTVNGIVHANSFGVKVNNTGELYISKADITSEVKPGAANYLPIVPSNQHAAAFYGLAKAAGDTTQSTSDNAVGTYTDGAKTAIRNMLGAVGDVQVNGTSIISNGIANVPLAASGVLGVVKTASDSGILIDANGNVKTNPPGETVIKTGTEGRRPIVPYSQHISTFYGLAKAAGDTTQSASSNAVGTYTTEAKSAIQSMLGIDIQSIASEVEIPLVETVTGSTPSITGQPNTRYNCGEVSTLSITPPSAGSIDVVFESGSTAAVLTVPNTVKFPAWFDATVLESDTIYEILITDGVYGSVMTWAN